MFLDNTLIKQVTRESYSIKKHRQFNDISFYYGLAVKTGSIALQKFFFVFFSLAGKRLLLGVKIFFPDLSQKKWDTQAFFFYILTSFGVKNCLRAFS